MLYCHCLMVAGEIVDVEEHEDHGDHGDHSQVVLLFSMFFSWLAVV